MGGLKCVILVNGMGWSRFFVNTDWIGLKWILCVELDHGIKISRSYYKILSKLTQICWRSLSRTESYSVQNSAAKPTRGAPYQEPDPEIKTSRSHYKILSKLTEICWR